MIRQRINQAQKQNDVPISQALPRTAVQSVNLSDAENAKQIHQTAIAGVQGTGQPLPHLSQIQESFGDYNVGNIQAYVGDRAMAAARSLSADAYATGNRVAFASANPSLHTAAHEAAHVVQQRSGVHLKTGVGQAGDAYERQADRVADAVTQGKSAEAELQQIGQRGVPYPATLSAQSAVQMHFAKPAKPTDIHQSWKLDPETQNATELRVGKGPVIGLQVTRFTALLSPTGLPHHRGHATVAGTNPLGWEWIEKNEQRSAKRQAISNWVRFHLLNAELGGDGRNINHLVPTDKTTNSNWDVNLEEPMKRVIEGTNGNLKNPNGDAIYYDVNIEYWKTADAPTTYNDTGAGVDYSPNITLFPKEITGDWEVYSKNAWQAKPQYKTGIITQPAGVGGQETELTTSQNFGALEGIYGINREVLKTLQDAINTHNPPLPSYHSVRAILEAWAGEFDASSTYMARMTKLAQSDENLRSALEGSGRLKIKIHNKFISDDDTPSARAYASPASVKSGEDLNRFKNVTNPLRSGFFHASENYTKIPAMAEVVKLLILRGHLYGHKLDAIQKEWNDFVDPTVNPSLPPMKYSHFAPEKQEVIYVVNQHFKTPSLQKNPLTHEIYEKFKSALGVIKYNPPSDLPIIVELQEYAINHFQTFLSTNLVNLTMKQVDLPGEMLAALILLEPTCQTYWQEFESRLNLVKQILVLGASPQDLTKRNINPFHTLCATPLTAALQTFLTELQQKPKPAPVPLHVPSLAPSTPFSSQVPSFPKSFLPYPSMPLHSQGMSSHQIPPSYPPIPLHSQGMSFPKSPSLGYPSFPMSIPSSHPISTQPTSYVPSGVPLFSTVPSSVNPPMPMHLSKDELPSSEDEPTQSSSYGRAPKKVRSSDFGSPYARQIHPFNQKVIDAIKESVEEFKSSRNLTLEQEQRIEGRQEAVVKEWSKPEQLKSTGTVKFYKDQAVGYITKDII